jgi:transglutaminase-like putative cysteine protease
MKFEVVHTTHYEYSEAVSISHHLARLVPRTLSRQRCTQHELRIDPEPGVTATHDDYFGNPTTFFVMQSAHRHLTVRARSIVELAAPSLPSESVPWEASADRSQMPIDAMECVVDSPSSRLRASLGEYARRSFLPGRPFVEAVADLTSRIHSDFTYAPGTTNVATPLGQVLESKRGVCQDFARFEIGCLRALGVPARYVSGYLETVPRPGAPRLLGSAASHAWLAVYCPEIGWIDVDPTNNFFPRETHVTLAWGRDFDDVSPLRGVILGGGEHLLHVSVDVNRVPAAPVTVAT